MLHKIIVHIYISSNNTEKEHHDASEAVDIIGANVILQKKYNKYQAITEKIWKEYVFVRVAKYIFSS